MNEKTAQTLLDVLAQTIEDQKLTIESKDWYIRTLEKELLELKTQIAGEEE